MTDRIFRPSHVSFSLVYDTMECLRLSCAKVSFFSFLEDKMTKCGRVSSKMDSLSHKPRKRTFGRLKAA